MELCFLRSSGVDSMAAPAVDHMRAGADDAVGTYSVLALKVYRHRVQPQKLLQSHVKGCSGGAVQRRRLSGPAGAELQLYVPITVEQTEFTGVKDSNNSPESCSCLVGRTSKATGRSCLGALGPTSYPRFTVFLLSSSLGLGPFLFSSTHFPHRNPCPGMEFWK